MLNCLMVTVLTPTYNRVNTLPKLVDSLCRQTRTDFQWLVIDDGSTDDTEAYMETLKQQNLPFEWEYHKKENGGKHTALNAAHPYIKGDVALYRRQRNFCYFLIWNDRQADVYFEQQDYL